MGQPTYLGDIGKRKPPPHTQTNPDWRLLAVASPKYNHLLLTHKRIFPQNLNEMHASVFE